MWPLTSDTQLHDVMTNATDVFQGSEVFVENGDAMVGGLALYFPGTISSHVDLIIRNSSALWESERPLREDYSISMLIYMDGTNNGTLFHFQSDSYPKENTVGIIERIKFYVVNGYLHADYEPIPDGRLSGTIVNTKTQILPNTWTQVAFGRDSSNTITHLVVNAKTTEVDLKNLDWMITQFPGRLRLGNSFDTQQNQSNADTEPFTGKIQCVQLYANKWPCLNSVLQRCGAVSTTTTTTPTENATTTPMTRPTITPMTTTSRNVYDASQAVQSNFETLIATAGTCS